MKKFYFMLMLLAIVVAGYAQTGWETDGKAIRTGLNIGRYWSSVKLDDNSTIYVWADKKTGSRAIRAQKIDENGNKLWNDNGILINDNISSQTKPKIVDLGGYALIFWLDNSEGNWDGYAQKINYSGNVQWNFTGIPIIDYSNSSTYQIIPDDLGGFFLFWKNNYDIKAKHFNENGEIYDEWVPNSNIILQNTNTLFKAIKDDSNGFLIFYSNSDSTTSVGRFSSIGEPIWNTTVSSLSLSNISDFSKDNFNDYYIVWNDPNVLYAQKINLLGELLWENNLMIAEQVPNYDISCVTQNNDLIIIYDQLKLQKISSDGILMWDNVNLTDAWGSNKAIVADGLDGCWILWNDYNKTYVQHLNENGQFLIGDDNIQIMSKRYSALSLYQLPQNKIGVSWFGSKADNMGIYYQIYDYDANPLFEDYGESIISGLGGSARWAKALIYNNIAYNFWVDTRSMYSQKQIYMQAIDHNGNTFFSENGIPISPLITPSNSDNIYDVATNPLHNEIALAWKSVDENSGMDKIFVGLNDSSGNPIWGEDGISVVANNNDAGACREPHISCIDPANSSYMVAWSDSRIIDYNFAYKIYAQKFDNNGNRLWGDEGKQIQMDETGLVDYYLKIVIDDYLIWESWSQDNTDLYITRLDENGDPAEGWNENALILSDAPGYQENAEAYLTPQGLLVVWQDLRDYNYNIYGQLVSPSGNILWEENGKQLVEADNAFSFNLVAQDDNFSISWVNRSEIDNRELEVQKFDYNGNPIWDNPLNIISTENLSYQPSHTITENGNIYVSWSQKSDIPFHYYDLYAQKIAPNGNIVWNNNGIPICEEEFGQFAPIMLTDDDNYVYSFWYDQRGSIYDVEEVEYYSLYGQIFTDDVKTEDDDILPVGTIIANYPNPFKGSTKFVVNTKKKIEGGIIKIYNLKGELVKKILTENSITKWDGKNSKGKKIGTGIYFYKFISKNESSKVKKMILIK